MFHLRFLMPLKSNMDNPDHMHDPRGGVRYPLLRKELWRRLDFSSLATSRGSFRGAMSFRTLSAISQTAVSITSGHCTSSRFTVISTMTMNIVVVVAFIDVGISPQLP